MERLLPICLFLPGLYKLYRVPSRIHYLSYLFRLGDPATTETNLAPEALGSYNEVIKLWTNLVHSTANVLLADKFIELKNSIPNDQSIAMSILETMPQVVAGFSNALQAIFSNQHVSIRNAKRNISDDTLFKIAYEAIRDEGKHDVALFVRVFCVMFYPSNYVENWHKQKSNPQYIVSKTDRKILSNLRIWQDNDGIWKAVEADMDPIDVKPLTEAEMYNDFEKMPGKETFLNRLAYRKKTIITSTDFREIVFNQLYGPELVFNPEKHKKEKRTQKGPGTQSDVILESDKQEVWFLCPVNPDTNRIVATPGPRTLIDYLSHHGKIYCILDGQVRLRPYFYMATYIPDVGGVLRDQYGYDTFGYDPIGFDFYGYDAFGRDYRGRDFRGFDYKGFNRFGWSQEILAIPIVDQTGREKRKSIFGFFRPKRSPINDSNYQAINERVHALERFVVDASAEFQWPNFPFDVQSNTIALNLEAIGDLNQDTRYVLKYQTAVPEVYLNYLGQVFKPTEPEPWIDSGPVKINRMAAVWYAKTQTFVAQLATWAPAKQSSALAISTRIPPTNEKHEVTTWDDFKFKVYPNLKVKNINDEIYIKTTCKYIKAVIRASYKVIQMLWIDSTQGFASQNVSGPLSREGQMELDRQFFRIDTKNMYEDEEFPIPIIFFGIRAWPDWQKTLIWIITNGAGEYLDFEDEENRKLYDLYWDKKKNEVIVMESDNNFGQELIILPAHMISTTRLRSDIRRLAFVSRFAPKNAPEYQNKYPLALDLPNTQTIIVKKRIIQHWYPTNECICPLPMPDGTAPLDWNADYTKMVDLKLKEGVPIHTVLGIRDEENDTIKAVAAQFEDTEIEGKVELIEKTFQNEFVQEVYDEAKESVLVNLQQDDRLATGTESTDAGLSAMLLAFKANENRGQTTISSEETVSPTVQSVEQPTTTTTTTTKTEVVTETSTNVAPDEPEAPEASEEPKEPETSEEPKTLEEPEEPVITGDINTNIPANNVPIEEL